MKTIHMLYDEVGLAPFKEVNRKLIRAFKKTYFAGLTDIRAYLAGYYGKKHLTSRYFDLCEGFYFQDWNKFIDVDGLNLEERYKIARLMSTVTIFYFSLYNDFKLFPNYNQRIDVEEIEEYEEALSKIVPDWAAYSSHMSKYEKAWEAQKKIEERVRLMLNNAISVSEIHDSIVEDIINI
ncbi:hypothetical protein [Bacillus toyonensis]|uniref:hypothetical protein n=1 Tax=Bacillus toyonensis TaxID=155322 RepID=UPI002E1C3394|nr:hypothetical protein [Bacillus toyonensis]